MNNWVITFNSEEVKKRAKEKGMTIRELSDALGYSEKRSLYRALETGRMSALAAQKLEQVLDLTPNKTAAGRQAIDDLKPCPFCGGKAAYDTNGSAYWVICIGCGARSGITYFDRDKGKRIVTEAWNRRASDDGSNRQTGGD